MFKVFTIVYFLFLSGEDDLKTGINYFNARSENANGLQANAVNVDKAIEIFDALLKQGKDKRVVGGYYMQCLNFKGRFVYTDDAHKKIVYKKAIELGNELVKEFPRDGKIRFELVSSIGLLAEINGVFKSIEDGVMSKVLDHTKKLIEYDSLYNEGGGWKTYAVLNYKLPYVPMVLTWPSNEEAKKLMKKALKHFPLSVGNNFYYGEALYENNEKKLAKIYFGLTLKHPCRKDFVIEDEYFKAKAKKYLDSMK